MSLRRFEAACAALTGLIACYGPDRRPNNSAVAQEAVALADDLISLLDEAESVGNEVEIITGKIVTGDDLL